MLLLLLMMLLLMMLLILLRLLLRRRRLLLLLMMIIIIMLLPCDCKLGSEEVRSEALRAERFRHEPRRSWWWRFEDLGDEWHARASVGHAGGLPKQREDSCMNARGSCPT